MRASDLGDVRWHKSTRSGANGNCVEVAHLKGDAVALRDSKNPAGPALAFDTAAWSAFLHGAKARRFDLA